MVSQTPSQRQRCNVVNIKKMRVVATPPRSGPSQLGKQSRRTPALVLTSPIGRDTRIAIAGTRRRLDFRRFQHTYGRASSSPNTHDPLCVGPCPSSTLVFRKRRSTGRGQASRLADLSSFAWQIQWIVLWFWKTKRLDFSLGKNLERAFLSQELKVWAFLNLDYR